MTTQYTFHEAVAAIDRATITGRPFPRALHDNVTSALHDAGDRMLLLDWHTAADRDQWLDYFGARAPVNDVIWADGWHGWTVVLTAHRDDSGAGAIEVMAPSPAPGTSLLAVGEAAAADLMGDGDECEVAARRTHRHRAADLDALASAIVDPDATIAPCGQTTRREVHGSHTRHVGACSRYCVGWDAPTVQMATVTA